MLADNRRLTTSSATKKYMAKSNKTPIIGAILLILNILWVFHFAYYLYSYIFRPWILWFMMYPYWILILNILVGITGVLLGILLIKDKVKPKACLIIEFVILLIGFFIAFFYKFSDILKN